MTGRFLVKFLFLYGKKHILLRNARKMNNFLVCFSFLAKLFFGEIFGAKENCMKNYTKISEIVENFTVPLAFFRKGGILRLYSDADFPDFLVRMDMH